MIISTKYSAIVDPRNIQEQYVNTFALMLQEYMLSHDELPKRIKLDVEIRDSPRSIAFECDMNEGRTNDAS